MTEPGSAARRLRNRLSLWRSKIADTYWDWRCRGDIEPLHPVREIRLLNRVEAALADRRAALACQMIAPVCANCGREIDKTPEGWTHAA